MQVGGDAAVGRSHERDEPGIDVLGLDRRDAQAVDGGALEQHLEKVGKALPAVVVAAQIDAREHHLARIAVDCRGDLLHNLVERDRG